MYHLFEFVILPIWLLSVIQSSGTEGTARIRPDPCIGSEAWPWAGAVLPIAPLGNRSWRV
jgi:hypothetical protein